MSKKYTQLPQATEITGDEIFAVVQAGQSVKTTVYDSISVLQRSGTALAFDRDAIYGTNLAPETTDITAIFTAAKLSCSALIIHNASVEPAYPASFKKSSSSEDYLPDNNNYILCTFIDSSNVIYSIIQTL